jgi:hypothetical protein
MSAWAVLLVTGSRFTQAARAGSEDELLVGNARRWSAARSPRA